ncbi:MAG: TetR family transcriptional regulator [Desulfovibrio sp.]|nr:TetR family transcriptional regulator [Desulfovibrio sp.]
MTKTVREDLRVKKTLSSIDKSFRELVLEREYEQITVSEICKRAVINKKTFYAHFHCLDDLLRHTLEDIAKGYIARIARFSLPEDLLNIHREFFLYSIEQGEFYEKLVCSRAYQHIARTLLGKLVKTAWQDSPWFNSLDAETQNMLLCFLHSAGADMYRQWIADGKGMPLEDAIAISGTLLCKGVDGIAKTRS